MMDPAKLKAAIDALKNNDGEAALALLESMLVDLASGAEEQGEPGDAGAMTTEETPAANPPDPNIPPKTPPGAAAPAPNDKMKQNSLPQWMLDLAGTNDQTEAQARLKSVITRGIAADRDAGQVELAERRSLIGELVTLGVETPATAWQGSNPEERKPSKRLAQIELAELRSYVESMRKARPASGHRAPESEEQEESAPVVREVKGDVSKLSADELAECKKRSIDPQHYANQKANSARRLNG